MPGFGWNAETAAEDPCSSSSCDLHKAMEELSLAKTTLLSRRGRRLAVQPLERDLLVSANCSQWETRDSPELSLAARVSRKGAFPVHTLADFPLDGGSPCSSTQPSPGPGPSPYSPLPPRHHPCSASPAVLLVPRGGSESRLLPAHNALRGLCAELMSG
eukprot:RCo012386